MTPPQDDDDAYTYRKPRDKIQYLESIMNYLSIAPDKISSKDGNLTTDQMRVLYQAILEEHGIASSNMDIQNNKPSMALHVAQLLGFDEDEMYVGAKNGVISISWYREIY